MLNGKLRGRLDPAQVRRWWRSAAAGSLILLAWGFGTWGTGSWGIGRGPGAAPLQPADVLMLTAAVIAGAPIAVAALRALRVRTVGIDLLVTIAGVGAIILGNYWEAAAVTFLFTVGHALEDATLTRTRSALSDLIATAPEEAIVVRDGLEQTVAAIAVRPEETVLVKTGMRVPVDGLIVGGSGALDEASITGESLPVDKGDGDQVWAGTILTAGFVTVHAQGVGADTTLARIITRVEDAQDAKAATQKFMDRFSRWYTPAIILLALVTGVITRDAPLALTLLVIGCPGALVISIPVAIVAGIGRGAKDGILIKGGEFLERSARISTVAIDKTGTLTLARPRLTDLLPQPGVPEAELLLRAAWAERTSDHPLAEPIVDAAERAGLPLDSRPETSDTVTGQGVLASTGDEHVAVGNLRLLQSLSLPADQLTAAADAASRLADSGRTPMLVAHNGRFLGALAVADAIRPEAGDTVAELHRRGVQVVMLTGDQPAVARAVAEQIGLDDFHAGLLPEDKLTAIERLREAGQVVAMVGDGVNDAPAMAGADIGIAMGAAGSPLAIETADIALMGDRLDRLPRALGLAKGTVSVMRQNVAISLITVAALLAGVFVGGVTMSIGMLIHELSVLLVIVNAMRLLSRGRMQDHAAADRRRRRSHRHRAVGAPSHA